MTIKELLQERPEVAILARICAGKRIKTMLL
jgi:hypothetical protein